MAEIIKSEALAYSTSQLRIDHHPTQLFHIIFMSEIPAFTAGVLSLIGGVVGFARKRSVPSLIGGVGVGGLYIWSGLALQNGQPYGLEGALGSSLLLLLSSAPRFLKGTVPKLLSLASACATVYYGLAYVDQV